jgi:hypothetical protein
VYECGPVDGSAAADASLGADTAAPHVPATASLPECVSEALHAAVADGSIVVMVAGTGITTACSRSDVAAELRALSALRTRASGAATFARPVVADPGCFLESVPAAAMDAVPPFAASILDPVAGTQVCRVTGAQRRILRVVAVHCEGELQKHGRLNVGSLKWRSFRLTPAGLYQLKGSAVDWQAGWERASRRLALASAPLAEVQAVQAQVGLGRAKVDLATGSAAALVSAEPGTFGRRFVITSRAASGKWATIELVAASAHDAAVWVSAINAAAAANERTGQAPTPAAAAASGSAAAVAAARTTGVAAGPTAGVPDGVLAGLAWHTAAASRGELERWRSGLMGVPDLEAVAVPPGARQPPALLAAQLRLGWAPGRGEGATGVTTLVPLPLPAEGDDGASQDAVTVAHILRPALAGDGSAPRPALRVARLQNACWMQVYADRLVAARRLHGPAGVVSCATAYCAPDRLDDVHAIVSGGPLTQLGCALLAEALAATPREALALHAHRLSQWRNRLGLPAAAAAGDLAVRSTARTLVVARIAFISGGCGGAGAGDDASAAAGGTSSSALLSPGPACKPRGSRLFASPAATVLPAGSGDHVANLRAVLAQASRAAASAATSGAASCGGEGFATSGRLVAVCPVFLVTW